MKLIPEAQGKACKFQPLKPDLDLTSTALDSYNLEENYLFKLKRQ